MVRTTTDKTNVCLSSDKSFLRNVRERPTTQTFVVEALAGSGRHLDPRQVLGGDRVRKDRQGLIEEHALVAMALGEVGQHEPPGARARCDASCVGRGQVPPGGCKLSLAGEDGRLRVQLLATTRHGPGLV